MKVQILLLVALSITTASFSQNAEIIPRNYEEICEGVFFAARPFPGDQSLFIGCIREVGMLQSCFPNEIFDAEVLECVELPTTPTPETTTTSETTTDSSITPPTTTTELPITTTTSIESSTTLTITPEITTTESLTTTEITTSPTTTESITTPTTTESITTTTAAVNPCAGITSGRVPNPNDCTLCYQCFMFQVIPVDCYCEPGQIFWINNCVPGNPATCQPYMLPNLSRQAIL